MTVKIREDSIFQFASPYFDEEQDELVWGIADPPDPIEREDDIFYEIREGDRLDLISYRTYGNPRYFWVIMHYNNIPNALDISDYIGKELRMPSRAVMERVYLNVAEQSVNSQNIV